MPKLILAILSFALLSACSNERLYDVAQGARMNQCTHIADNAERARCYDNATQSYDRYEQNQQPKP